MKLKLSHLVGAWAFLAGVLIAVVLGAIPSLDKTVAITLAVAGVIVGLLNVTHKETNAFLVSSMSLILASAFGWSIVGGIPVFGGILSALLMLFVPATIVVAVKNVFLIAKE